MEHLDPVRYLNLPYLPFAVCFDFVCGPNICVISGFPKTEVNDGYYKLLLSSSELPVHQKISQSPEDIVKDSSTGYSLFINKGFLDNLARQAGIRCNIHFLKDKVTSQELLYLVDTFFREAACHQEGHALMIHSLEIQIVISIIRCFPSGTPPAVTEKRNINLAIEYICENYQEHFSLAMLAKAANYSNYHFIRVFKSQTGKTPFDYLMDIRVEKAAEMLLDSKTSITDICFACGFTNPSHFTTVFKRKKGTTPSYYQKTNT